MNRSMAACAAVLAIAVQGCSMNVFGSAEKPTAAAAPSADAAPSRPPEMTRLSRFDANTDGLVQRAELEDGLKVDFQKEDANGNELLDPAEARVLNERLRDEPGTSPVFDWNGDGRLVYSEFATQWRTLFDRSDRNGDGTVDAEEIKSSGRERKPRALPQPTFSGKDGRPPGSQN
jgi:Ca2+-binding EF-hand superfamily protein